LQSFDAGGGDCGDVVLSSSGEMARELYSHEFAFFWAVLLKFSQEMTERFGRN